MTIGILALQGNYQQHKKKLDILGMQNIFIRNVKDLDKCDSLIIPGGESTTISKQIDNNQLRKELISFAHTNSIFGTCAGMIMLSTCIPTNNLKPLNIMDIQVNRNSWGSQIHSFSAGVILDFDNDKPFHAVFIRAPKIIKMGKNIKVLSKFKNEPVLLTDGRHIASTFHPEIGNDFRIHNYFINKINERIPAIS